MGSIAPTRPRAEQLQSRLQKDSRHVRPREVVPLRWVPDAMRCFLDRSAWAAWAAAGRAAVGLYRQRHVFRHRLNPLRYRTQTSLPLNQRLIEIISNDLFFALKLEPISHFPGMNHLLLARDAGMRLERP